MFVCLSYGHTLKPGGGIFDLIFFVMIIKVETEYNIQTFSCLTPIKFQRNSTFVIVTHLKK